MIWQGKAIGALIGLLVGGPLGALVGVLLGALFDSYLSDANEPRRVPRASASVQEAFFRATFQVMGHIAKADGRVSEADIHAARRMMGELGLGERELHNAMALFREGKARDFPLASVLGQLHDLCRERPDLCRMFVQIQLQTALWGASLNTASREVLAKMCAAIGVSAYEVVQMEALLRMQQYARQPPQAQPSIDRVAQAYAVLGVKRDASNSEVTKAYRRLMSQNHPDKLVAKGLPESMMKVAQEKTQQIRAAYEILREARGMR
jgi:DnaJ like chaperone protein